METYTPDPTNNVLNLTVPDDGDDENVGSIVPSIETVADKAWQNGLAGLTTVTRHVRLHVAFIKNIASGFTAATRASAYLTENGHVAGNAALETRLNSATGDYFRIAFDLEDVGKILHVDVIHRGVNIGPNPPAHAPTYQIVSWDGGNAPTTHSSIITGSTANWLTADMLTTITASGGGFVVDKSARQYGLEIVAPWDVASSQMQIVNLFLTYQLSQLKAQ